MSDCYLHPGRDGVGACVNCGQIICAECKTVLGGKMYCQRCAEKLFIKEESGAKKPAAAKERAAVTMPAVEQKGGKRPWLIPAIIGGGVFAVVVIVVIVVVFAVLIPASRESSDPMVAQPPAASEQPSTPPSSTPAADGEGQAQLFEPGDTAVSSILGIPEVTDWKDYPDLGQEQGAIDATLAGFKQSLSSGDVEQCVKYIYEEKQEVYRQMFQDNTEMMPAMSALLDGAKMSFLSAATDSETTSSERIAEYSIDADGFTFYIVFIKIGDNWLLYDF